MSYELFAFVVAFAPLLETKRTFGVISYKL